MPQLEEGVQTYLRCGQSNMPVLVKEGLFVIERFNDRVIVPLSKNSLNQIPPSLRRSKSCEELGDYTGVDISKGYGTMTECKNFFENTPPESTRFLFSISRASIKKYLGFVGESFPERKKPSHLRR